MLLISCLKQIGFILYPHSYFQHITQHSNLTKPLTTQQNHTMSKIKLENLQRVYVDIKLREKDLASLSPTHSHYLKNVLRMETGDYLRVFNAENGEFLATIESSSKKNCVVKIAEIIRKPSTPNTKIHLFFPPIKKDRLDFLIEKAVELGVTDLHPILTQRGNIRDLNCARITSQMIEAAEQCERLDIPTLHPLLPLNTLLSTLSHPIMAAIERSEGATQDLKQALSNYNFGTDNHIRFLIGPEGGWSEEEREALLNHPSVIPITLGPRILRVETACLTCLAALTIFTPPL